MPPSLSWQSVSYSKAEGRVPGLKMRRRLQGCVG